ncbi:LOW QUALITY PROTEIN: hypothetical protein NC651_028516 [Populus alba x Populus x berolinensis]|nr:LOW QUALITY PROTEIN: hypothetical protein NC651_028516 [Populus alba x Populus x berolinensis]
MPWRGFALSWERSSLSLCLSSFMFTVAPIAFMQRVSNYPSSKMEEKPLEPSIIAPYKDLEPFWNFFPPTPRRKAFFVCCYGYPLKRFIPWWIDLLVYGTRLAHEVESKLSRIRSPQSTPAFLRPGMLLPALRSFALSPFLSRSDLAQSKVVGSIARCFTQLRKRLPKLKQQILPYTGEEAIGIVQFNEFQGQRESHEGLFFDWGPGLRHFRGGPWLDSEVTREGQYPNLSFLLGSRDHFALPALIKKGLSPISLVEELLYNRALKSLFYHNRCGCSFIMREYARLKTYELTPGYMNEISCKEGPFNNKPFLYIITCLLNRVKLIRNILRDPTGLQALSQNQAG